VDKFGGILRNNQKKKRIPEDENPHKDSSYINNVVGKRERKRRRASHATGYSTIRALYDIIRLMMEAIGDSRL
jgi:hypothetical protein